MNRNENQYHGFSYIKQFHDPSFVFKCCYKFKRFQSDFLIFFQNYPLNQYYRDHQFCHFSTAKIPSWYMAFIRKIVFQRKSNASPINLWNKILGQFKLRVFTTENIYGTRVTYDLLIWSCIDKKKRELRQHLKLWRKFAPFPPVKTPKIILDFTVVIVQKERQFYCAKVGYKLLEYKWTLPLRAHLFTFNVFVTVIIMYKTL